MNFSLIVSISSAFIAALAFIIAWLSYRLNRKLPNENKLFEEKFKSYRSLIAAFNNAAAVHIECAYAFEDHGLSGKELEDLEDDLDDDLNKSFFQMEDTLNEQMLVLPDEVLEPLEKYFMLFDKEDFLKETAQAGKTAEFEVQINSHFDTIIDAMREDLSLKKLDVGLKNRIGVQHRVRRLNNTAAIVNA